MYNCICHGGERVEIFADVLFVINFSMDFLALFLTGKILSMPVKGKRLAAASALGALCAVLRTVFPGSGDVVRVVWTLGTFSVGAAMCLVAYNGRLIRTLPVFLAANLALGGLMSVLGRFMRGAGFGYSGTGGASLFAFPAVVAGVVCVIYGRLRPRSAALREADVSITIDGRTKTFHMLVDSGNLLTEPLSGRAVILVSPEKMADILPEPLKGLTVNDIPSLDSASARRVRLIPAKGIGNAELLIGLVPDRIIIDGREIDAIAATADSDFGGLDGIIPSSVA